MYDVKTKTISMEGDERTFRVGDVVRHFKRETVPEDTNYCLYEIIGVAEEYGTGKYLVVYRELDERGKTFARSIEEFYAPVNAKKYPRIKQKMKFVPATAAEAAL